MAKKSSKPGVRKTVEKAASVAGMAGPSNGARADGGRKRKPLSRAAFDRELRKV